MCKSALSRFASASSIILVLFMFNTISANAQTVAKTTVEVNSLQVSTQKKIAIDSIETNTIFQKKNLIDFQHSNTTVFCPIFNLVEEEKLQNKNSIDTIQFVQFYRQFYFFYKNIS